MENWHLILFHLISSLGMRDGEEGIRMKDDVSDNEITNVQEIDYDQGEII